MKRTLLGTSILLTLASTAKAEISEGQFPVLKTNLACDIKVPAGYDKSQVYFSKDCQTAFIIPGSNIKITQTDATLMPGADEAYCQDIPKKRKEAKEAEAMAAYYQKKYNEILDRLGTASASDKAELNSLADRYLKEYTRQSDLARNPNGVYNDMAALRIRYVLSNQVMDSIIAFQTANLTPVNEDGKVYPIRFMPAQLTESYLSVAPPDQKAQDLIGRAVIRVNFPGLKPSTKDQQTNKDQILIPMNGGLSGTIDISTAAYCINKKDTASIGELLRKTYTLNNHYSVRAQAGVRIELESSITTKDFVRSLQNTLIKGKFRRNDFTEKYLTGALIDTLSIYLDDKGNRTKHTLMSLLEPGSADDKVKPFGKLIADFFTRYTDNAEDKLKSLGVFTVQPGEKAKDVEYGQFQEYRGTQRICRTESALWGAYQNTHCTDQPIYVTVDADGISELLSNNTDNSTIESHLTIETDETITIPHSSAFY